MIHKHLGKLLDTLFAEFTGVHFHIAWTPASPRHWDAHTLPTGCSVCCRLTGSPLLPLCRTCGPRQLARTLSAADDGHRFTCHLGVRNYWIPIQVRDETLGIAYLQALENPAARPPARKRSARAARARLRRAGARVLNRLKFARAARFLRHIVQHVQTATLSDLHKADLTSAGRAVLALEKEQARLHLALKRHLPPAPQAPRRSGPESNAQQLVHHLLERLELDYAKPITLQHYARELGMNAAYLSDLFSRALGVPFKSYLTDLRLEKARALLGDPARSVSDVAYAVGYASENRFRFAFKQATGLSPRLWRETMQTNP
ncbi:MAG: AraC family transcriptional regulator [Verrucomicrobiota bacterium]